MAIVKGGKGVYGFRMGIIMLETHFPRIPGDVGNASTWSFPVIYRVAKDASPHRVVNEGDISLLEPFIDAAEELEGEGASAITTSRLRDVSKRDGGGGERSALYLLFDDGTTGV